jgi:hypothetical protein
MCDDLDFGSACSSIREMIDRYEFATDGTDRIRCIFDADSMELVDGMGRTLIYNSPQACLEYLVGRLALVEETA